MAESDLIRGNVDTVILKVLYEGDRYGYDMIKQINAKSGGQWEIKQPTLYACLKRLEKQGFVASYWDASESNGGRRKYYTLTDSGREVFISYKNEWERSRDLFGELITDDEPIIPNDDFSDVEDDDYDVPKRPARPRIKKPQKQPVESTVEYVPPTFDGNEYVHTAQAAVSEEPTAQSQSNNGDETKPEPGGNTEYVQQSIFDNAEQTELEKEQERSDAYFIYDEPVAQPERETDNSPVREEAVDVSDKQTDDYDAGTRPTVDPHSVIEEIYASTYTGNRSYSDARASAYADSDEYTQHKPAETRTESAPPAPPTPSAQPVPAAAPASPAAPVIPEKTALQPYSGTLPGSIRDEESVARREYKDILEDLVESCESGGKNRRAENEETAASVAARGDGQIEVRRFDGVRQAVSELGNEVTVRAHNDSAKQYTHKYYYFSNRLLLAHYTAMCGMMLVLWLTLFLTFYFGLEMRMAHDGALYTLTGLLPIAMIVAVVILFACNPDKKKRININFRFSFFIRFVIMLQAAVIIYCFNLIWGMPVGFSEYYIPSLVLPCVYAVFIPASEIIFMTLLKSGRYAIE